eukprot:10243762-Alexandrium_andersonii.AAC.1
MISADVRGGGSTPQGESVTNCYKPLQESLKAVQSCFKLPRAALSCFKPLQALSTRCCGPS